MAKQKLDFSMMGKKAAEAGHQLAAQDREQEGAVAAARADLPIDQVLRRPSGDTRPVDPFHVLGLAESIAAVGLLEPVVIDSRDRLIAGAHRLAALRLLAAESRQTEIDQYIIAPLSASKQVEFGERLGALPEDRSGWKIIPVRRLPLDADQDQAGALAAEVAENERRRDYTRSEIQSLAERLKGFGFKHSKGRPRAGEKSLIPALEVIVGKSKATLWRVLTPNPKPSVNVSHETFTKNIRRLEKLAASVYTEGLTVNFNHERMRILEQAIRLISEAIHTSNEKQLGK